MRHGDRHTVCLSSQSGCALACTFCATGRMGLGRNLTPEEIGEQLLRLARLLRDEQGARVANVVMMGMGEPFHNYDNVLAAIRTMNDPEGFGLGARQIQDLTRRKLLGEKLNEAHAALEQRFDDIARRAAFGLFRVEYAVNRREL